MKMLKAPPAAITTTITTTTTTTTKHIFEFKKNKKEC
jgi:hypothetical protein